MLEFRLPDPGEGLVEADIVTWRVAVGDQVAVNDILVEIETAKSLVELPSPYAGTVARLLVAEGQTVEVGTPIIGISDGSDAADDRADGTDPEPPATVPDRADGGSPPMAEGEGRVANLVGYGPRSGGASRRPRKASPTAAPTPAAAPGSVAAAVPEPVREVAAPPSRQHALAKPPVRKYAKDLGVDLTTVVPSADDGVITRADVDRSHASAGAVDVPATGGRRVPIKGVRKATAEAMVRSAFTAPHVTEWVTVDVTATVELAERLRSRREFAEVKVTPLLLIMKATCLALSRTPELVSSWDEAAQEIVLHDVVNLGIAAATPRGLVVPNIKAADTLGLLDLGRAFTELVATARSGRTPPAAMQGGTFTITNVGTFGVDGGTPILNPGEAGILCVGAVDRRPWVVGKGADERIEPRWVSTLSVSFDHRLADGEQGSRFLAEVAAILSDPGLALLY